MTAMKEKTLGGMVKMCVRTIRKAEELLGIDPRLIIGFASRDGKTAEIIVLGEIMPLNKKVAIKIPGSFFCIIPKVAIRSIQVREDGLVLAEFAGQKTPEILAMAGVIAAEMKRRGIVNAFFPAYADFKARKADFLYGRLDQRKGGVVQFLPVADSSVRNIVFAGKEIVVFSIGNELRKMSLTYFMYEDWRDKSTLIKDFYSPVMFIGRMKEGVVPVTLKDGGVVQWAILNSARMPEEKFVGTPGAKTVAALGLIDERLSVAIEKAAIGLGKVAVFSPTAAAAV